MDTERGRNRARDTFKKRSMAVSINPIASILRLDANVQNVSKLNPKANVFQPAGISIQALEPATNACFTTVHSITSKLNPDAVPFVPRNVTKTPFLLNPLSLPFVPWASQATTAAPSSEPSKSTTTSHYLSLTTLATRDVTPPAENAISSRSDSRLKGTILAKFFNTQQVFESPTLSAFSSYFDSEINQLHHEANENDFTRREPAHSGSKLNVDAIDFVPLYKKAFALVPQVDSVIRIVSTIPESTDVAPMSPYPYLNMVQPKTQDISWLPRVHKFSLYSTKPLNGWPLLHNFLPTLVPQFLSSTVDASSTPQILAKCHIPESFVESSPTKFDSVNESPCNINADEGLNETSQTVNKFVGDNDIGSSKEFPLPYDSECTRSQAFKVQHQRMMLQHDNSNKSFCLSYKYLDIADDTQAQLQDHKNEQKSGTDVPPQIDHPFNQSMQPLPRPERFANLSELRSFGPSQVQLATDARHPRTCLAQSKSTDDMSSIQKPYHHISFLGHRVSQKSNTDPALSLAIINTPPKGDMFVTDDSENLHNSVILHQAFTYIDPVVFYGEVSSICNLSASQIRKEATGQVRKVYSALGTWLSDTYDFDEDEPELDSNLPEPFEGGCIVYNGHTETKNELDKSVWEAHIEHNASVKEERRRSNYAARKKLFPEQLKSKPSFVPPFPSPLRHSYTSESMAHQSSVNTDTLSEKTLALLRPSVNPWADIDDEDDDQCDSEMNSSFLADLDCLVNSQNSEKGFASMEADFTISSPVHSEEMLMQSQIKFVSASLEVYLHNDKEGLNESTTKELSVQFLDGLEQKLNHASSAFEEDSTLTLGEVRAFSESAGLEHEQELSKEVLLDITCQETAQLPRIGAALSNGNLSESSSDDSLWEDVPDQNSNEEAPVPIVRSKKHYVKSRTVRPSRFTVFVDKNTAKIPSQSFKHANTKEFQHLSMGTKRTGFSDGSSYNNFVNIKDRPKARRPTNFVVLQDKSPLPKRRLVRSEFVYNLANFTHEAEEDKENILEVIATRSDFSKVIRDDDCQFAVQHFDNSKPVDEINRVFDSLHDDPQLREEPLNEWVDSIKFGLSMRAPSTIKKYRQARRRVEIMPCITSNSLSTAGSISESRSQSSLPPVLPSDESDIHEEVVHTSCDICCSQISFSTTVIPSQTAQLDGTTCSCFASGSINTSQPLPIPTLWPTFDGAYDTYSLRSTLSQASIDYAAAFRTPNDIAIYTPFTSPDDIVDSVTLLTPPPQPQQPYILGPKYLRRIKKHKNRDSSYRASITKRLTSWKWFGSTKKETETADIEAQWDANYALSRQAIEGFSAKRRWFSSVKSRIAQSIRGRK